MRTFFAIALPLIVLLFAGSLFAFYFSPSPSRPYFLRHSTSIKKSGTTNGTVYESILSHLESTNSAVSLSGVFFHGDRNYKRVALTFDADMTSGMVDMLHSGSVVSYYDDKLIAVLRRNKVPATLFLSGLWVEQYPNVTKELASDPLFEIGSHSFAHQAYSYPCYYLEELVADRKIEDIGSSQMIIEKYTGQKVKLFRFPGGCFSQTDLQLVSMAGMKTVAWDTVADDGFNPDENIIAGKVLSRAKNGSIIVMHMNGFPNEPVDYLAVEKIVNVLREKGIELVKVSELLNFN